MLRTGNHRSGLVLAGANERRSGNDDGVLTASNTDYVAIASLITS